MDLDQMRKWFDQSRLEKVQVGDDLVRTVLYVAPETRADEMAGLLDGQILGLDPNPEGSGGNAHMHFSSVRTPNLDIIAIGVEAVITTSDLDSIITRSELSGVTIAGPVLGENNNVIGLVSAENIEEVIYLNPKREELLDQIIKIEKHERESSVAAANESQFEIIGGADFDG